MSFVSTVVTQWSESPAKHFVIEMHGKKPAPVRGGELHEQFVRFRAALRDQGVGHGDRVVVLADNSASWVALDFAILAEGAIPAAMYVRQSNAELTVMFRDAEPSLVICGDNVGDVRRTALQSILNGLPAKNARSERKVRVMSSLLLQDAKATERECVPTQPDHPVSIVYTSGTSGDPKGVVTTRANVEYMLPILDAELTRMTGKAGGNDRVFHYLPFCFAGSRMLLWTSMLRGNPIWLSTNLDALKDEMEGAAPEYFLNVPTLLERIRAGVETQLDKQGGLIAASYRRAKVSRATEGGGTTLDKAARAFVQVVVFPKLRRKIGVNLRTLICGSAPLSPDTQNWFHWLGIDVYQVYGLTETTAIVSMDRANQIEPGRVGMALPKVEIRFGEQDELQVRGPNVFSGYFRNETATREAFTEDGWFRTGDQASMDTRGRIAITGRVKNILVLESGHNVAPEPLEIKLVASVPSIEHAVIVGHGRPHMVLLVSVRAGETLATKALQACIDELNASLPHYKRIRAFAETEVAIGIDNGLLTANQKLRRRAIEKHFASTITRLYRELETSKPRASDAGTTASA